MNPSSRSRSNHTSTDLSPVLAILGPGQIRRASGRLHPYLAGSPVARAVSSSLAFGTNFSSRAAPHPALQRRSCLQLHPGLCLRGGYDFHILCSWLHGRTRWRARRATLRGELATYTGIAADGWSLRPCRTSPRLLSASPTGSSDPKEPTPNLSHSHSSFSFSHGFEGNEKDKENE